MNIHATYNSSHPPLTVVIHFTHHEWMKAGLNFAPLAFPDVWKMHKDINGMESMLWFHLMVIPLSPIYSILYCKCNK
jgi:hypothetical protein